MRSSVACDGQVSDNPKQELPLAEVRFLAVHGQGLPSAQRAVFVAALVGLERVGLRPRATKFFAVAQVRIQSAQEVRFRMLSATDSHAIGFVRGVGPLPSQDAIHKAFSIRQGDSKWQAPVVRVRIWLSVLHPGLCSPGGGSWPLAHELPARLQLVLL